MNSFDASTLREFVGLIWIDDRAAIRLRIKAQSVEEARSLVEAEYGEGHAISLWNETDAARQR